MFEELVKRLRNFSGTDNIAEFAEAADAIEGLSMRLHGDEAAMRPSNADRIRAMTDEELAQLLRDYECNRCDWCGLCEEEEKCQKEILDWLKQEADNPDFGAKMDLVTDCNQVKDGDT